MTLIVFRFFVMTTTAPTGSLSLGALVALQ